MKTRSKKLAVSGLSLVLGACAADVSELGDAHGVELGKQEQAIDNERFGGIAERTYLRYSQDPAATLRSYAAVTTDSVDPPFAGPSGWCSGIMIGPNLMISAGHCHGDKKTATFRAYVSLTQQTAETFKCDPLVQTWPENDLTMHWCYPNAEGINPGDRWGYVDLDIDVSPQGSFSYSKSIERVAVNAPVYAVWSNPLTWIGGQHHLYSQGKITNTGLPYWFNPGGGLCSDADDYNLGVQSDAWAAGGASGSSTLSLSKHRLLLGPLSGASPLPDGAPGRWSSAIADLLWYGRLDDARQPPFAAPPPCAGRSEPQLNVATLSKLWSQGIRFGGTSAADITRYMTYLDANSDGIFDIHHDLELSAGEARRDFYDLGFESNRRNALWTRNTGTDIDIDLAKATMDTTGFPGDWYHLLDHSSLHLDPSARYRVSYRVLADSNTYISVCTTDSNCTVNAVTASQSKMFVDTLSGGSTLRFWIWGSAKVWLSDVTVADVNTLFDFDTADLRAVWRKPGLPMLSTAAYVLPNNTSSATKADWGGVVRPDTSPILPAKYTLSSDRIGVPQGRVRVCFDYRRIDTSSAVPKATMHIANTSGSDLNFAPTSVWKHACNPFATTTQPGNAVEFGAEGSTFAYAVDNIVIEAP